MAAILQVVASVGSTTSLLDLNDNPAGILIQGGGGASGGLNLADVGGGDVAMPVWTGPGGASTPEATTRTITVPVHLLGATVDAVGAKVSALAKLVGQPWVLRVRRSGASVDGWIRCYPTIPSVATDITGSHGGGVASGVITAQTEPYAYGARVDKSPVTVPLVNVTTANAFVLDVASVTGDAPTPAFIRTSDTTLLGGAHGTLLAVRRTGTPTSLTGLSVKADTAATASVVGANVTTSTISGDAAMSAGTARRFIFALGYTPASGANLGRVVFTPALTGAEAPGMYKLLMRARRSLTWEFTFYPKIAGVYNLDAVTWPGVGSATRMIDLGTVQLPAGQAQQLAAPTAAVIGAEPPSITVDIWYTGANGAPALDLDYFLLVPCDEDAGVVYQSAAVASGSWLTVDGFAQDAYLSTGDPLLSASTGMSSVARLDYVGGVPRLYPGITNRMYAVGGFSPVTAAALAQSAALTVSFWPRYTWLP